MNKMQFSKDNRRYGQTEVMLRVVDAKKASKLDAFVKVSLGVLS